MPFISLTRLRVRSWRYMPGFVIEAFRSSRQAQKAEGNLRVQVLRDARNTFWTCTAWDSEASMRKFMLANPHGPAMRKLLTWCDEASALHWTQDERELPSWPEAHRRMQTEGRASKVNHPSPGQVAYVIDPPVMRPGSDVRLK